MEKHVPQRTGQYNHKLHLVDDHQCFVINIFKVSDPISFGVGAGEEHL